MSGRRKSKRQRTLSSSREGRPNGKRTNTDDANKQPNVQRSRHCQDPSKLSLSMEATKNVSNDAKGGRALRPRLPGTVHSEDDEKSDDKSWEPESRLSDTRRQGASTKQHKDAARDLECTDYSLDAFFQDNHLPFCSENPPLWCIQLHTHHDGCTAASNVAKRIVASNVTQEILIAYGGWKQIVDATTLTQPTEPSTNTAARIYKDITLNASPIPWSTKPFEMPPQQEDGTYKIAREDKLDREIRQAWWWFRGRMLGNPLKIPLEWTERDPSLPDKRPEMPEAFSKLLRMQLSICEGTPTPNSSLDSSPVKKSAVRLGIPLGEGVINPLRLSTIMEQTESFPTSFEVNNGDSEISTPSELPAGVSTSASSPLLLPYFELGSTGSTPEADRVPLERAKLSNTALPQPTHNGGEPISPFKAPPTESRFKLAYSLIEEHGLKETKMDALLLEQYMADGRRKFDINQAKEVLCKYLGHVEGNTEIGSSWGFVYVPRVEIEEADKLERSGNSAKTENAIDVRDTAMELNMRWVNFTGIDETNLRGKRPISELDVERKAGILFVGLFRFDELQESANTATRFINHFQVFSTSPRPDHAIRPAPGAWPHWPDSLYPIFASGDTKTPATMGRDNKAQIALNTRPLLILEILMYLDTRQTPNEPLPGWMFNFSWVYDYLGVIIYIHYPTVELSKDGTDWSWKMVTVMLTDEFQDLWTPSGTTMKRRAEAKAAFDMVVTHTNHVLELNQVRKWSYSRGQYGEGSIMNQLIARAHFDEGNYQWMYEKVKKLKDSNKQQKAV